MVAATPCEGGPSCPSAIRTSSARCRSAPVTVRNRIMQTAHVKLFTDDGVDSQRNVAYQVERAKGGAGLLITGNRLVHPTSTTGMPRFAYQYLKGALEIDRKMTRRRARARGGHVHAAQPLRAQRDERLGGRPPRPLGPVGGQVACLRRDGEGDGARGHRRGDRLVGAARRSCPGRAASTARRCTSRTATCCTSSSRRVYNKRDDEYGGSFENRLRFTREVIDEVRRRVGRRLGVGVRITLSEFIPGGLDAGRRRADGAAARGRRARSTSSTSRRPATTTSTWRSSPRTRPTASSST